jgi:hypothetical protein
VWFDPFKFQTGAGFGEQKSPVPGAAGMDTGSPSFADSEQKAIISSTIVICGSLVVKQ